MGMSGDTNFFVKLTCEVMCPGLLTYFDGTNTIRCRIDLPLTYGAIYYVLGKSSANQVEKCLAITTKIEVPIGIRNFGIPEMSEYRFGNRTDNR